LPLSVKPLGASRILLRLEYDLFICHASDDKDGFVRPLVLRLAELGYSVWFDDFSLKPGDSLRVSIDKGLRSSRYCVVVLSRRFFLRQWTEWELNGIVQRQLDAKRSLIIPIWLELSSADVRRISPSLADLVAIRATHDIEAVAHEVANLIGPSMPQLTDNTALLHRLLKFLANFAAPDANDLTLLLLLLRDDKFEPITSADTNSEQPRKTFAVNDSFAGIVVREGKLQFAQLSPLRHGAFDSPLAPYTTIIRSELAVPLFDREGRVMAVLSMESGSVNVFADESRRNTIIEAATVLGPLLEPIVRGFPY